MYFSYLINRLNKENKFIIILKFDKAKFYFFFICFMLCVCLTRAIYFELNFIIEVRDQRTEYIFNEYVFLENFLHVL